MNSKVSLFSGLILVNVLVSASSQLLLKKAAQKSYTTMLQSYLNPMVIGAYAIFFGTTIINVFALKYVPLSLAAVLEATAYIYIPVLSFVVLKEPVTSRTARGILLIVIGIVIFSL